MPVELVILVTDCDEFGGSNQACRKHFKEGKCPREKIHISLMQLVMRGKLNLDYFHQSSHRGFISICDDFSDSNVDCKLICRGCMVNGANKKNQKNFPHSGEWLSANRTETDHLRGKERKVIFPIVRNRELLAIIVWRR